MVVSSCLGDAVRASGRYGPRGRMRPCNGPSGSWHKRNGGPLPPDDQLEPPPGTVPEGGPPEVDLCERLLPAARLFALRRAGADGEDLAQEAIALLVAAIRAGRIGNEAAAGGFLLSTCR